MSTTRTNIGKIEINHDGCVNYTTGVKYYLQAIITHPITGLESADTHSFTISSDPEVDDTHQDSYFKEVMEYAKRVREENEYFNLYNIEINI